MKHIIFVAGLVLSLASVAQAADDTKNVNANGKTVEVRVPKSAKTDCKKAENVEKTECKKPSKAMPKIEKPVEKTDAKK